MDIFGRATRVVCTKDTCPASKSIYGYAPNVGVNAFFVAFFAISCLTFCYQAHLYRKWLGFSIAMILGTAFECIGYGSRLMLSANPFSATGFKLNIVLLTFAPAFLCAGIYLLLKYLCKVLNPKLSPLRPQLYTPIFVSCDVLAIILQGAGGAMSAAADDNRHMLDIGVDVMIAGLSSQVVTLSVFGVLAATFFIRVSKHKETFPDPAQHLWQATSFRLSVSAVTVAFILIFIRCAYRIAELKDGWGSEIMRREGEFIVLDSLMIAVAAGLLNVFHPGRCFRQSRPRGSVALETIDLKSPDTTEGFTDMKVKDT